MPTWHETAIARRVIAAAIVKYNTRCAMSAGGGSTGADSGSDTGCARSCSSSTGNGI